MKNKFLAFTFIFGLIILPNFVFSQKAYNAVNYGTKIKDFVIKLKLADGYPEASEIRIIDLKTKKNTDFKLCEGETNPTNEKKFCLIKNNDTKHYVNLAIDWEYETLPQTISGNYFYKGKTYAITLNKQK